MAHGIFCNFDNILYMGQHLQLVASLGDDGFITRMGEIVKPVPPFKICFSIDYEPPFNDVTRYYHELIDQYKLEILHEINRRLTSKDVPGSRLEELFNDIKDELYLRRKHAETIMNSLAYGGYVLVAGRLPEVADTVMATQYCIFQYMNVALVAILCEMHFHFRDLVRRILWTGKYVQLTGNDVPDSHYIDGGHVAEEASTEFTNPQPAVTHTENDQPGPYVPVLGDFRDPVKGVIDYLFMVRNPKRFGWIEGLFFREGIIDMNNNFIEHHGHKKLLAAIAHLLIDKNYFNHIDEGRERRIKPYHVRRFLEHRYQVKLKKQFETAAKEVDERFALIESFDWLCALPMCEISLF